MEFQFYKDSILNLNNLFFHNINALNSNNYSETKVYFFLKHSSLVILFFFSNPSMHAIYYIEVYIRYTLDIAQSFNKPPDISSHQILFLM